MGSPSFLSPFPSQQPNDSAFDSHLLLEVDQLFSENGNVAEKYHPHFSALVETLDLLLPLRHNMAGCALEVILRKLGLRSFCCVKHWQRDEEDSALLQLLLEGLGCCHGGFYLVGCAGDKDLCAPLDSQCHCWDAVLKPQNAGECTPSPHLKSRYRIWQSAAPLTVLQVVLSSSEKIMGSTLTQKLHAVTAAIPAVV